jgi:hypothetical protein
MITNTNKLVNELVNKKLLIFEQYQVDVLFEGGGKHEIMFSIVEFLLHKILGIVE